MRKALLFAPMILLCLALLSACGETETESRQVQEDYQDLHAQAEVELTCHYGDEVRTYGLSCTYAPEKSTVTVTAPADLAGISAEFDGESLLLRYDDILIDAGIFSGTDLSPFWALPSLLRAMGEGYLLEYGREDVEDTKCLRAAFEVTGEDGTKTVYTVWLDESDRPVRGEITRADTMVYALDFISFTKEGEHDGGTDAQTDLGGD